MSPSPSVTGNSPNRKSDTTGTRENISAPYKAKFWPDLTKDCLLGVSQVRGSHSGLGKVDSAFHHFSGSINEYQAGSETKQWVVSRQTDHLTETSAHAP
ncbi:hypothetical protein TNCV_357221 [Trichonephila clavipes]|nr:hypothetical protein TNCV_357221 [Trichonephila clavipes]